MNTILSDITNVGDLAAGVACNTSKVRCIYNAAFSFAVLLVLLLLVQSKKIKNTALVFSIFLIILAFLFFAWNVFRYRMIDMLCDYTFPPTLGCPKYAQAWQRGFRNDKIVTTASNASAAVHALDNGALSLIGKTTDATAKIGGSIASYNRLLDDWDMNYELSKCATNSTMSKFAFVSMRCAMVLIPVVVLIIVVYTVFHTKITTFATESENNEVATSDRHDKKLSSSTVSTIFCALIGLIVGSLVGNTLLIIQSGRWRRKLGLTFIDWPRMVL